MEIGDVGYLRAADAELADLAGVDEKVDGRIGVSATAKAVSAVTSDRGNSRKR
jgi:hypothetical protein